MTTTSSPTPTATILNRVANATSTMPLDELPTSSAVHRGQRPSEFAGKAIYMVGIGGCGMSGLARLLRARGAHVRGSDVGRSPFTQTLERDGFELAFDQSGVGAGAIPATCDLLVASAAIRPEHPQLLAAQARSLPVLSYAEALGRAMHSHTGVCIAGTHGKSTTTAMLGVCLAAAGLDPSVIVGANCSQLAKPSGSASPTGNKPANAGGFRLGSELVPSGPLSGEPGLLLAEACEFNRSFHNYHPRVAAITSVEADHLDVFGSVEEVVKAFHEFARLIPHRDKGGTLLIAAEGTHRREVTAGLECDVQTIGWSPSCDWSVQYDPRSRRTGLVRKGHGLIGAWITTMPGEHNAMNAATACALATILGADPDKIATSLGEFKGLDRRMQFMGERRLPLGGAVRVYDDYGHHPTEVEATLKALRDFERPEERGGRLVCVFQPHQHSRTRFLLDEFASAFNHADVVVVPDIYFVRDSIEEKTKVTAGDLVDRLRSRGIQAMHLYPFDAIIEQLHVMCKPGDLLVVMGAGPVDSVARGFLGEPA